MKRSCLVSVAFIFLSWNMNAQIQYTRQTIQAPLAGIMQLVANVGGAHHLLYFHSNRNPVIYVYNSLLQSYTKKEIDVKPRGSNDINILQFKDHYLLYFHSPGSGRHQLIIVKPDGSSKNISSCLNRTSDSSWNRSKATFQLFNQNEQLVLLSHTYYDVIKKIGSTRVKMNREMVPVSISKVLFDFDRSTEILGQVVLSDYDLLVMKTGRNMNSGNEIGISRINFATGHAVIKTFDAGPHLYVNPSFRFNADSSLLVSSLLKEFTGTSSGVKTVFVCNLGDSLQELAPVTLLKNQFRKNAADNFLLLGEDHQSWLHMGGYVNRTATRNRIDMRDYGNYTESNFNLQTDVYRPSDYYSGSGAPTAIRFSFLNNQLKTIGDTVVANSGNTFDVLPRPFGRFVMNNKAYLVLVQNFTPKRRGLLLVSAGKDGKFQTEDISVYDRYEYQLSQLKAVGNEYFIVPYTYKNETGLVKVRIKE